MSLAPMGNEEIILFAAVAAVPIANEKVRSTVSVFVIIICFTTKVWSVVTVNNVVVVVPSCVGALKMLSTLSPSGHNLTPYIHCY